jgi:hypothetical protein
MYRIAALLLLAGAFGCTDATAPSGESTIIFRVEPNCSQSNLYNLLIDGETVSQREMAPLDSAKFSVEPGQHTAGAIVADGMLMTVWYPQVVDLAPNQRYVARLGCG